MKLSSQSSIVYLLTFDKILNSELCSDPNGFYPHPTDCQKYYQCGHGTPYEYTCPSGTLWNDDIKNCDWAANVQCTSGPGSVTTTASPLSTQQPQSTTTSSLGK